MFRRLLLVVALVVTFSASATAEATLLYPNLKTLAPRNLRFDRTDVSAESTGELHNVLRFSNTVYNAGEGPAEIRATIDQKLSPPSGQAYQRIYESTGGYKEVLLPGSTLYYHAVHKHYHFDHWGAYQLWTKAGWESWLASGRTTGEPFLIGQKTTACVEDEEFVTSVLAAVWPAAYPPANCLPNPENVIAEGLSPGWGDTYDYYRFEQWIDLGPNGSLPEGTYVLRSVADPNNIIYESPEKSDPLRESQQDNEGITVFKVVGTAIKATEPATGTVTINHVEKLTSSSKVSLEVLGRDTADEVDQFRVSNDGNSWQTFANSSYDSVTQTVSWDLANATYGGSSASGMHTVYVEFHDAAGWGPAAQDTIDYEPPAPPISAYGKAVNADGPVGWWRLGELSGSVAADQTGIDPGSYVGSVTLGRPSLIATDTGNAAVGFDGKSATVKIPAASQLNLTAPLSLEAWIKPASLPATGAFASVLTKPESYSLQFNGPRLEFTIIQSGTRHRLQAASGAIVAGNTYYVVATFDGTTQRLYVNGAQVASATLSGTASVTTNPLFLASWDGAGEFFAGTVDEAAVYSKTLTATQIKTHYEAAVKAALAAPSGLTATAGSSSRIDLAWTDNSSGESGETVQRSTDSSFGSVTSFSVPAGTTSFSDTGLSAGTTYWYRVAAVSGSLSSPYSNIAQATTQGAASYPSTVLADHPVSYWRLDETSGTVAGDQTVANPGTYVAPTLGAASLLPGEPSDGAVAFNGTSSDVRVGQAGTLNLTSAMTLEAWIKPASLPPAGSFASIVTKPESYSLQLNGPTLELVVIESGFRMRLDAPAGTIVAGGAYYVVGTFDGATERLYVNGEQVASTSLTGAADLSTGGLHIGSWDGTKECFSGTIDEPAIYAKALTSSQVAAHYGAAKPPLAAPTGLTASVISASRIDLSWTNHASSSIGEVVQRSASSSFSSPTETALPAGAQSYSDTGLTAGTTYWYRVKAVTSTESSAWSSAVSATTSSSSAYASTVAADAPVSWWRLDEASGTLAADQRNVNPGTYLSGVTLRATSLISATQGDAAVAFDGLKGAVKIAQSNSLNLTSAITLEAWIKPASLPATGAFVSILTKPESYSLQFNGPKLEFTIIQSGTRHRLQAPSGAIATGSVYQVTGTFDGVTQRLYINGKQVASAALSGAASLSSAGAYVGSWDGSSEFFKGVIDEPAIYGKALSAEAVSRHYAAGIAP